MAVEVGAEFDNYDDLTNAVKAYEAENFVNLIIRDTRKVEAAAKRNQRKNYNPEIKYSDISYCCTYGGKKYISHSTGKRNHTSTKQACPFSLKVRATVDGQRLFVREMCSVHNHEISEAEFRLHPKQRKLDMGSQEEIANLLSMEPDKKLLRDKLMQITGKVILMKDIHNIKTRLLNRKSKSSDSKGGSVEKMEHSEGTLGDLVNLSDSQVTVETQTPEDQPEEIRIPISHVGPPHLDSNQHTIMVQQPGQQLDNVQQCYVENQAYQQQPNNVYTVNVQSFQPTQVYSLAPQPFQQSSPSMIPNNPIHSVPVPQMDPQIRGSQQFQHWTTLEDMGRQAVQESSYPTITTLSFPDQPSDTHVANQQQQQQAHQPVEHQAIQISSSEPVHSVLLENPNIPPNNVQPHEPQPLQGSKRGRKKRTTPPNGERKRKKSAVQADKDNLMKKYFQQATVNLFFNERLKSPGSKLLKTARPIPSTLKMSQNPSEGKFHDHLRPLSWLFGKWRSEHGKGIYPNLQAFSYGEEIEFEPVAMKPMVEYRSCSWKPDNSVPLHIESGFIRIKPDSNHIAFMAAHNLGVVEIQEGEVKGQELTVETASIGRASFNKPPAVKKIKRTITRHGNELEQVMDMETENTSMTEHLRVTWKKVE